MKIKLLILSLVFCEIGNAQNSLLWATYFGGTNGETGNAVATDAFGNVYIAGRASSSSNLAFGGFQNVMASTQDAFLVKFNSLGERIWATYYGGDNDDDGFDLATDMEGNVYLAGGTISTTNISSVGFQNTFGGGSSDAFLVKFDSTGNRIWATYYGGPATDRAKGVATDNFGNVYLTGYTTSDLGIASGGFQNIRSGNFDAFLVKFDASGNRLWATYYGGTAIDNPSSVEADAFGNVYIGGTTQSIGLASGGFQNTIGGVGSSIFDTFLVKFNNSGNRVWATYFGGTNDDRANDIKTNAIGDVYLAGKTKSVGLGSNGFQNNLNGIGSYNAFLSKFNASGNRLWSTYYGIDNGTGANSIATDTFGNVYLAGVTSSNSLAFGGFQNTFGGGNSDAFLVKFDSLGYRICSTYYGGTQGETISSYDNGYIASDPTGNIYLAGTTFSSSGIAVNGFQDTLAGPTNAYLAKFTSYSINTSIENNIESLIFNAFPNPSTGIFFINNWNNISSIEVYDIVGHKILTNKSLTSNKIDLSNSPKGIYFVKLHCGEKIYTNKIIVE